MSDVTNDKLRSAAVNAAALLAGVYEWLDRVEKAGGATSIEGVAACHAMIKSLRKNKPRVDRLVLQPLRAALSPTGTASEGERT